MAELDFSNLRPWLDEEENYANSIKQDDPRTVIAQQMLVIISEARKDLLPSADSTANYVPTRQIIEQLALLHDQAEKITREGKP